MKKKPRVVVSDDEDHIRFLMKTVMKVAGLEVVGEATNGQEALDLYKKELPDLILLDVNMPVKRGDEVLEELLESFPDASVIMLTSVADMETIERCISLGAVNYILKDTPVDEIGSKLKETVEHLQKP